MALGFKSRLAKPSKRAPMPGIIAELLARPGQAVVAGTPVMILESMKLLHTLHAPRDGTIDRVHVTEGQSVATGAELLTLTPADNANSME